MKSLVLISIILLCAISTKAQSWEGDFNHAQKLDDIVKVYQKSHPTSIGKDDEAKLGGKEPSEGMDFQFDRWVWYWRQHLDEKGYLVSPVKTMEEWNKYKAKLKSGALNKTTTTNESQWTFNGPSQSNGGYYGLGRIQVVSFHPTDSNTFIIGSAGGGAWRTTNGGLNWTCITDGLNITGVADVDYNPLNPNTIYLCTGDRDGHYNYSIGLLKSYDAGATWNSTGLQYTTHNLTNSLLINPLDTNSLTVATATGIMKSYDGGTTWFQAIAGFFYEIHYCTSDTNIIYAASSYMPTNNIYRSADGGATWLPVTNLVGAARISIAVTSQNPAIVKAICSDNNSALLGIYTSSDTGKTFTKIYGNGNCNTNLLSDTTTLSNTSCSGQGEYDLCIAIDPTDTNKVVIGGVNTYQSLDGGHNWQLVNQWANTAPGIQTVHADKHYFAYNPLNPSNLYECNDGGIYRTSNPASLLWTDLTNGLGITQFERNAVADAVNYVLGGAQDNGTKYVDFSGNAMELTGGDGEDCQIDYLDTNTIYTSYVRGVIYRINANTGITTISNNIPGQPVGAWISPIIIHPKNHNVLLAGLDHLYVTNDSGSTWTDLTPTLSNVYLYRIAMSPSDSNMIYYLMGGTTYDKMGQGYLYNNTSIRFSPDFGITWLSPPTPDSGVISDICVDPKNKNSLWVTYAGYTATKVANYIVGSGWTNKTDSLPNVPINCIVIDSSNGTKYVGTDIGVYYKDTSMSSWQFYNNGMPIVQVHDLGINYTTNEIWAATYGRGMWKSPRHSTLSNGISNIPYSMEVISVAPNPNQGDFKIMTSNRALIGQQVNVNIVSFSGASVMRFESSFNGSGIINVNASNFARGSYIVEVSKGNMLFARTKMLAL